MIKFFYRLYQAFFKVVALILPWRKPILLEGKDKLRELGKLIKSHGFSKVLIVTDSVIPTLGIMDGLLEDLKNESIEFTLYDKTIPNPTIDNIEEALKLYHANRCEAIIAFGGGSSMDCAKGVGARVARPNKTIPQMKGLFKVLKRIPMLYAVPTTAGTGSEATLAAVISNSETHEKYAINDANLFPRYAVLDPMMTVGLPPHITSTTGMDALTHAVEAYVGRSNTEETRQMARDAVKLIFANVKTSYIDGKNIEARANMLRASYLAGMAFTRAYVGYIHAIAHTLGGFYRVPHGLANAVIMPYVLDVYGDSAYQPLSELSDLVGLCDPNVSKEVKAKAFISAIRQMNKDMAIPDKITGIMDKDIPLMVERAIAEANPLYPVPKILFKEDIKKIYTQIKA